MAEYIVKKGDTLSAIAKQYGTTYQEIAKANGISDPNKISVGQKLVIGDTTTSTPTTTPTTQPSPTYKYEEFKYDPYEKSDTVKQAEALLQQQTANAPGEYQSNWQAQLSETLDKILNREKFSYDLNGDALYQQYKDQYTTQGKMAMMDTMGQAAAATGGYGNSYAQAVGQQTYQGYLKQLNDKVPELYQLALSQYNQEGQDLKDQASLLYSQEQQDYNRYRDSMSDYWTQLDYLTGRADTLSQNEYNKYMDDISLKYNIHSDTQSAGYQAQQDAYEKAMSLLGIGVTPDSNVLSTAGISSAEAQAIVQKVKEQEAAAKVVDNGGGIEDDEPIAKPKYEETKAVSNFVATIRTKNEFARGTNSDNKKYKTYEDYVYAMLEKYEKDLTDDEIATIVAMYGLKSK